MVGGAILSEWYTKCQLKKPPWNTVSNWKPLSPTPPLSLPTCYLPPCGLTTPSPADRINYAQVLPRFSRTKRKQANIPMLISKEKTLSTCKSALCTMALLFPIIWGPHSLGDQCLGLDWNTLIRHQQGGRRHWSIDQALLPLWTTHCQSSHSLQRHQNSQ